MDDVVELDNVRNLCRLCLSTDEPRSPIFGVQESSVPLVEKIQACLSIEVLSNDKLSTLICINCTKSVNQWHTYKESCLQSQEKLQRWLSMQTKASTALIAAIKPEPMDIEIYEDNIEIVEMPEDGSETMNDRRTDNVSCLNNSGKERINNNPERLLHQSEIKSEPIDDDEVECNIENDSVNESELLINPMALGANKNMEPDSTQKFNAARGSKKKIRRGPHTHFRGVKVYKQRCPHCHLNLHSKTAYAKHVERYHRNLSHSSKNPSQSGPRNGGMTYINKDDEQQQQQKANNDAEDEEMIEDVEEELVSLEKDAPLTKVQESIISQLKTFSCYACQQSFNDRRSTLNHIRQHMPDLRPYTCIACLTEFPDRSIYKLHCGASFECAMKIALVVPKHGTEKYFTCNMCLRPMPNRKELISHLSKHSDRQYEQLTAPVKLPPKLKSITSSGTKSTTIKTLLPYRNGDPAHNHTCDYCGMIYRYKPNMVKHQDLCKRLSPDERSSYRCVHCGMTFLVFKKFQSHLATEHNKKDIVCYVCNTKFKFSNEFLVHHQKHRLAIRPSDGQTSWNKVTTTKFGCTSCPKEFSTRAELSEHRNTHLKMKIFSCTVCRRMFGNSQSLQEHMNDHGPTEVDPDISAADFLEQGESEDPNTSAWPVNLDPAGRSTECTQCGKSFANYPNLRRHIRSAHSGNEHFNCFKCTKTFRNENEWNDHCERAHKENSTGYRCNYCKKKFDNRESMELHQRNVHALTDDCMACDICGKEFGNETSLKIHRGHHFRRDSRLSIRNMPHPMDQVQVEINDEPVASSLSILKSPKVKKSFSNGSSPKATTSGNLQCQVCDDRFTDVQDLRKHLWDIHCAKNKPEKSFAGDLQCELCTNLFADQKSLDDHMNWHKDNPILSDGLQRPVDISCDICGKFYSSLKALWKHKKLHKSTATAGLKFSSIKKPLPTQFPCPVCRKVFGNETSMKKHKAAAHFTRRTISSFTSPTRKPSTSQDDDDIKPKRPKLDFDIIRKAYNLGEPSSSNFSSNNSSKKPVTCSICKKLLPSMSSLYKHRQNVHKQDLSKSLPSALSDEIIEQQSGVPCTGCDKIFSNTSNMKQHYTKVHGNGGKHYCNMEGCNEVFNSPLAKQTHEKTHMNILYSCNLCSRHMFTRIAMNKHLTSEHKSEYQPSIEKSLYKKTDLNSYVVKGAEGRVCPMCNITYPNIKAMKIHYVKIHENNS
ncbi:hypothetical protein PV326_003791 [Microctonus aethiopoides]|nr:hypothetical protein PV326_003791 [Microctonus aethiopoides]